ncbi:MAG: NAD(+) synthase [Flavobacteriales bacterium]
MDQDPLDTADHITAWMRGYCTQEKRIGFVLGVSGGVDSAVASTLAARTGLPVLALSLPIHQAASELQRARAHLAWLRQQYPNVQAHELTLDRHFDELAVHFGTLGRPGDASLALVNTKSRLRLSTLYFFATLEERLVVGTGNKVEQRGVGFFAKYGDGGMDLAPLAELTKSEVYALAHALGVARTILDAPPTDGLWPDGRTDFDQIGATYPELEWAMDLREHQVDTTSMDLNERQLEVLRIYDQRHADSRHKLGEAPTCHVPRGTNWPQDSDPLGPRSTG